LPPIRYAKPKTIVTVLAVQSLIVLFSSFGVGISFGIMGTLMILMIQPVVTSFTVLEIAGWLLAALGGMFLFESLARCKICEEANIEDHVINA